MSDPLAIGIAFVGGLVPALIWLWFWSKEDVHPEPRFLVAMAFVAGMFTVGLVIPPQRFFLGVLEQGAPLVLMWSLIEELFKFGVAGAVILWRSEVDEPIDMVIYMITVALGFAAAENALFLLTPLSNGAYIESILTGNFRFFGAMLLHVLASSVIGVALALAYHRSLLTRSFAALIGLVAAVGLHALFNLLILESEGQHILRIFSFVWLGLIVLMLVLERVKHLKISIR